MRRLALGLLLLTACQSGKTGLAYIDRGYSFEASVFKTEEDVPVGLRASVGRIKLPNHWANIYGDWAERYALTPFIHLELPYGFYVEPNIGVQFVPGLGTPFEPISGLRLGYCWKHLEIFGGVTYDLGNGYRHERLNPPEYEHYPSNWHPEFGIVWGFDF